MPSPLAAVVTALALTAIASGALFLIIRAAVEQGIRRALPEAQLRPLPASPPTTPRGPHGEQV